MGYTTPSTWVVGAVLTAAQLNQQIRDNLNAAFPLGVDAWTGYTPTLTQAATVTKTSTYAKYQRVGRLITAQVMLTVTGAGTASNIIAAGLPVTAAGVTNLAVGAGWILDVSASLIYKAVVELATTTSVQFRPSSTTGNDLLGTSVLTAGLAVGDLVTFTVTYESAT